MTRLLCLLALCWCVLGVAAQDVVTLTELTLTDGSRLVGTVIDESETEVIFETVSGLEMTIPLVQIASRSQVRGRLKDDGLVPLDPNVSRLFFSSTGRPLPSGTSYLAFQQIFFASAGYGATDQVTLAGGLSLFPGAGSQLYFLAPKVGLWNEGNRAVSAGVLLGGVTGEEGHGGIVYSAGTFGAEDKALTLGVGFLFGGGEWEDSPVVMIGGEWQTGPRFKFITENYLMPSISSNAVVSGGVRMIGSRLTADFALFTWTELLDDGAAFPFIPWISFSTFLSD